MRKDHALRRHILFWIWIAAACLLGCKRIPQAQTIEMFEYFDTLIDFTFYGTEAEKASVEPKLRDKIASYHRLLDRFAEDGETARINRDRGGENPELARLLERVMKEEKKTGCVTDVTRGKLFSLWRHAIETSTIPSAADIRRALGEGGYATAHVEGDRIVLEDSADLDWGSISKGYLNDRLVPYIRDTLGIENFILNAGGNVTVCGHPPDGRHKFGIGIRSPFDGQSVAETLFLTDLSAVTSGDYQRAAMVGDRRIHHMIDLKTGEPRADGKRSVTIVGPESFLCDFLSTAVFLTDLDEVDALMRQYPEYMYYIIRDDKTAVYDERLEPYMKSHGASAN